MPKVTKRSWFLHGVKMTKKEFYMDANEVDIEKYIINETNVQRRMAFMMKVGTEMLYQKLGGKTIDEEGETYKLIMLNLKGIGEKPYLYMKNPSVPVYHMEGVPEGTKTVEEAIHSRKPEKMKKIKIDDQNGEDWYQQGDVCVWPKNAKSLKSRPTILT